MNKDFFSHWMRYADDSVKLTELVMPGAHNAGSYGMKRIARCQEDRILEQYLHGARQFCVRMHQKDGKLYLSHGLIMGRPFVEALEDFKKIIETYDDFFIINLREYQPQKLLFTERTYRADAEKVEPLLKEYIQPEKYAFYDFDNISDVTLGDIRRSGKKYLLINYKQDYAYSRDCVELLPWDKKIHGSKIDRFLKHSPTLIEEANPNGLYIYQSQRTAGVGTNVGMFTPPRKMDRDMGKKFFVLIEKIATNPELLKKINIIGADFLTDNFDKSRAIIYLNLLKNNVRCELIEEFKANLIGD